MDDDATKQGEGEQKPPRTTRKDSGLPRLTPRDLLVLLWIAQQYAIRIDQLQHLLARLSGVELENPGRVSASTARTAIARWQRLGLVVCRKILASRDDPAWIWLTPRGLHYLETGFSYYEPKPGALAHLYLINQARLYVEAQRPDDTWKSERELRKEEEARPKHFKAPHRSDGLLLKPDGSAIAVEVERYDKGQSRLVEILRDLSSKYHRTWYFVAKSAMRVMNKALADLSEEQRQTIQILSIEEKLLGQLEAAQS